VPRFRINCAKYVVFAPGAAQTSNIFILGFGAAASTAKQLALS
jgi:hypothetical protein